MYDREVTAKAFGGGVAGLLLVALLIMQSGVAFAVPIAGVGGFTIQADSIEGNNLYLYPGVDDTSEMEGYPMAVTEFTSVKIEGLVLQKEFSDLPAIPGNARVQITATDTVTSDAMMLKMSKLEAGDSTFRGLSVDENHAQQATRKIGLRAPANFEDQQGRSIDLGAENPGITLQDADIQAHYLATNRIEIPGITLSVQYDQDGNGQYEYKVGS